MALSDLAKQVNRQGRDGKPLEVLTPFVSQLRGCYGETRKVLDEWVKK
jgi:hypothetical protein